MFNATKDLTYAIIGASSNPDKYGNKVLFDLLNNGYHAIPVNPNREYISDVKVYPTIKDVPENIDVAVFVVPPTVTESIIKDVKDLEIKKVWMQPGASSQDAVDFCEANGIDCMHDVCVMLQKN